MPAPVAAGFRADRLNALPGFHMRYPDWRAGYAAILAGEGLAAVPA